MDILQPDWSSPITWGVVGALAVAGILLLLAFMPWSKRVSLPGWFAGGIVGAVVGGALTAGLMYVFVVIPPRETPASMGGGGSGGGGGAAGGAMAMPPMGPMGPMMGGAGGMGGMLPGYPGAEQKAAANQAAQTRNRLTAMVRALNLLAGAFSLDLTAEQAAQIHKTVAAIREKDVPDEVIQATYEKLSQILTKEQQDVLQGVGGRGAGGGSGAGGGFGQGGPGGGRGAQQQGWPLHELVGELQTKLGKLSASVTPSEGQPQPATGSHRAPEQRPAESSAEAPPKPQNP
jgi:hypothetical protein